MAQQAPPLFNFYFRYSWDQHNFGDWQTGMVQLQRGAMEGLFAGAVMSGFDLTAVSGMLVQTSAGIACGPTGYLMVENTPQNLLFTAPTGNVRMDLIVVQPLLTNASTIADPDPTSPRFGQPVPLQSLQDCQVSIVLGTESATPDYPAVPSGAVVIAGVRLTPGMVSFPDANYFMDTNHRWIYGKNSNFQQNAGRYDDRLRPFRSDYRTLGIKPSQLLHPRARGFAYTSTGLPSIYPKAAGVFSNADSFLNFQTGAISGGDTTSSAFTPTIPTAGNYINATVSITTSDTINVSYGTQGTHTQCIDGIQNVKTVGAGCLGTPTANAKIIAFVTLYSSDGVNINSLEYVDARGPQIGVSNGFGALNQEKLIGPTTRTITSSDDGKVFLVNASAGQVQIQLGNPATITKFMFKDISGDASLMTKPLAFLQFAAEQINGVAATFNISAPGAEGNFIPDGTNWWG